MLTAPTSDLERFRQALDHQRSFLLEANRSSRFQPPTDLASAQLNLLDNDASGEPITAEIIDLNGDGMRVAISPGPVMAVGQRCQLRFLPESGEGFELRAEVRWVEANSYIQVFGIQVLTAEAVPRAD